MTKAEAVSEFNELYPRWSFQRASLRTPHKHLDVSRHIDKPMRAEAWNNFTDALCKARRITMKQYETWLHPWRD